MKITKTVKLKITSHSKIFNETLKIYNEALLFMIDVISKEWKNLESLSSKERVNFVEKLTHETTKNPYPKYDFDFHFYKFPSYLRRATISEAIGNVSSHFSRLKNWEKKREAKLLKNKKFYEKPPKLPEKINAFPVFYRKEMFKKVSDGVAKIKIFYKNEWKWIEINYKTDNLHNRNIENWKEQNQSLIRKGKKYFLHFPFTGDVKLSKSDEIVIGVDLGLTNSAVCSAVDKNGTVIGRKFINQPKEKDRLKRQLGKLAKAQRKSGLTEKPNLWRKINNLQKYISQNTVDKIIKFANEIGATKIVFEHLGKIKGRGKLKQKLQFWRKNLIQEKTIEKAHNFGMRVSRVLARGTSKYAFDGSGEISRNNKKDLAEFENGKKYHADLSASYNIASRYFIREILKPLSETRRLQVEAKVPFLIDRSRQTLSSLISLRKVV
jgi:putative transposase